MSFEITRPHPDVTHLVFKNMKELTTSMFRIEEYYESPYAAIKGQYFSVDAFIDVYADDDGDIEYFRYWDGFNVPRASVEAFEALFRPHGLTPREEAVLQAFHAEGTKYLIATSRDTESSTVDHEIAHALWSVDAGYREQCRQALALLEPRTRKCIVKALLKADYPDDEVILEDEIHAYLKTDTKKCLKKLLSKADKAMTANYKDVRKRLRAVG